MNIGERIALCRKKAGMSQESLANELQISRQAVSRWERGEAVPDTENIIRLNRIFHVSTDYLLLGKAEEQTAQDSPARPDSGGKTDLVSERRAKLRIFCGKFLLIGGLSALAATLIGAGFWANALTEWWTDWGRYGTALFQTWLVTPFWLSICAALAGIYILFREYLRKD